MLKDKKIGFILTGSFYSFNKIIPKMKQLVDIGAKVVPIMSFNSYKLDTRCGEQKSFIEKIEKITSSKIINSIETAEQIGIKHLTDIIIVAPCSGNTLAKLANGIADTPATVAVKFGIRNENNIVIGISSNDGLSTNAVNIGILLNRKNFYFIPFRQSNPITNPCALMFDIESIVPTLEQAISSKQIQPIII